MFYSGWVGLQLTVVELCDWPSNHIRSPGHSPVHQPPTGGSNRCRNTLLFIIITFSGQSDVLLALARLLESALVSWDGNQRSVYVMTKSSPNAAHLANLRTLMEDSYIATVICTTGALINTYKALDLPRTTVISITFPSIDVTKYDVRRV